MGKICKKFVEQDEVERKIRSLNIHICSLYFFLNSTVSSKKTVCYDADFFYLNYMNFKKRIFVCTVISS
jgi:hypothetical protein